jgi:hypothetical protein
MESEKRESPTSDHPRQDFRCWSSSNFATTQLTFEINKDDSLTGIFHHVKAGGLNQDREIVAMNHIHAQYGHKFCNGTQSLYIWRTLWPWEYSDGHPADWPHAKVAGLLDRLNQKCTPSTRVHILSSYVVLHFSASKRSCSMVMTNLRGE